MNYEGGHQQHRKGYWPRVGLFLFISIVLALVLMVKSSVKEIWTLNAGETRQVHVTKLIKKVQITSSIAKGISLYVLQGICPELTGPIVPLDSMHELHLDQGDYQYDHFYLNQGSSLDVTTEQLSGTSNIFLLKGTISHGTSDKKLNKHAILKRTATMGQTTRFQYKAPHSDTYTVVSENAFISKVRATITFHTNLTSFDVLDLLPVTCETTNMCTVDKGRMHVCILMQAHELVTIQINSKRKWGKILFWVILPFVIGICCFLPEKQNLERNQFVVGNPPATNPIMIPTAPPYRIVPLSEQDDVEMATDI
jgi:hypothetical protein